MDLSSTNEAQGPPTWICVSCNKLLSEENFSHGAVSKYASEMWHTCGFESPLSPERIQKGVKLERDCAKMYSI